MLNQRLNAARTINDQLKIAEHAIDKALSEAATLAAFMPQARVDANVAAEIGQVALERTHAAFSALVTARGELIAAHQELSVVKDQIGLRTIGLGGGEYKGTSTEAPLALVEIAA